MKTEALSTQQSERCVGRDTVKILKQSKLPFTSTRGPSAPEKTTSTDGTRARRSAPGGLRIRRRGPTRPRGNSCICTCNYKLNRGWPAGHLKVNRPAAIDRDMPASRPAGELSRESTLQVYTYTCLMCARACTYLYSYITMYVAIYIYVLGKNMCTRARVQFPESTNHKFEKFANFRHRKGACSVWKAPG